MRSRHFPLVVLLFSFVLACLPLLLLKRETNYTWDERTYYVPAILQIREHWPLLDPNQDSFSATAPGYQYLLAGISLLTGPNLQVLRFVNCLISTGTLMLLWFVWSEETTACVRLWSILPLACSNFFIKSACYVVTDNAALLLTGGTLALVLLKGAPSRLPWAGVLTAFSVSVRQITFWLTGPLAIRALIAKPRIRWLPVILPPCAILGWLVHKWGGLVPPAWNTQHCERVVFAAGAYQLALLAMFGAPYCLAASSYTWKADLLNRWTWGGAALGLAVTLAGPNNPCYDAGRWGGHLWEAATHLPVVGQYSVVFLVMSPLGGAVLGMLGRRLWQEAGWMAALPWLAAIFAFFSTGLSNCLVFQRYYEPPIIMLLVFWLVLLGRARQQAGGIRLGPLVLLSTAQLALTSLTAYARTFGLL